MGGFRLLVSAGKTLFHCKQYFLDADCSSNSSASGQLRGSSFSRLVAFLGHPILPQAPSASHREPPIATQMLVQCWPKRRETARQPSTIDGHHEADSVSLLRRRAGCTCRDVVFDRLVHRALRRGQVDEAILDMTVRNRRGDFPGFEVPPQKSRVCRDTSRLTGVCSRMILIAVLRSASLNLSAWRDGQVPQSAKVSSGFRTC